MYNLSEKCCQIEKNRNKKYKILKNKIRKNNDKDQKNVKIKNI